jgi:hypothetical protein
VIEKFKTDGQYRALPNYSQSDCKQILNASPREFQLYKKHGIKESQAMFNGTAIHRIALEGHEMLFDDLAIDRYPSEYGKKRSASLHYKEYKQNLLDTGKRYIKEEDLNGIDKTAKVIADDFGKLLAKGKPEISVHGIELIEGVKCKGQIDNLPDQHFIFDLKTTARGLTDSDCLRYLHRDMWKIQAAFYHDLIYKETGDSRIFVFLIVQTVEPYSTRKIIVDPASDIIASGRELYTKALEQIKELEKIEGDWPGYPNFNVLNYEKEKRA